MTMSSTNVIVCSINSASGQDGGPLISDAEKASIIKNVCRGPADYTINGENYCVLHAPIFEKEYVRFEYAVIDKIENGEPDFRGVWFPNNFDLSKHRFESMVDFSYAVFTGHCFFNIVSFKETVFFLNTTFCGNTAFQHCNFDATAYFNQTNFGGYITFRFAEFKDGCLFWESKFKHVADFQSTHFHQFVDFSGTVFSNPADFSRASFDDALYLNPMSFEKNAQMIIK